MMKGKSKQLRHQFCSTRVSLDIQKWSSRHHERHPQSAFCSVDHNEGQQRGDVDPHSGNGFFRGQRIVLNAPKVANNPLQKRHGRRAGNSGKSMCGSTVCSSSSAVFILRCRHYVHTRDSTVAVCLTIMYVKSRNSIKFQVIRKYRSLFTQATARSETEMLFRKESFE